MEAASIDDGMARGEGPSRNRVSRRLILYVHGFDPRGPGIVHALQREDAVRESARPDRTLTVGPRRRQSNASAWSVEAVWPEGQVANTFVALRWDDLVRSRWDRTLTGQARGLMRWVSAYLRTGAMEALVGASRTMAIGALALPVVVAAFLLAGLIVTVAVGFGLAAVAAAFGLPPWLGLAAPGLLLLLPDLWRRLDAKVNLCWLGRGHLHMVELSQGAIPSLDARIDAFADRLLHEAKSGDWDEILIIGHSSGSIHAADLTGRALQRDPTLGRVGPGVALITLGHCMPGYSMVGPTPVYAAALAALAEARQIRWLDITAAADPGAGGAWSPLRHSPYDEARVERRSPRFHKALSPEAFRALKADPMAYHFQYMRACDDPAVYDWTRLAFGPDAFSRAGAR